jgi:hypothetical protein
MKRFAAGLLAGVALAGAASAQQPSTYTVAPSGAAMPGTPVGAAMVMPAGTAIPKAVPAAGAKVGTGPAGIPAALDPRAPQGQAIDLKNVVAPYPGMPNPSPSFWDQLQARWNALLGPSSPPVQSQNWTPGIARRNRERAKEQMRMRD